MAKLIELKPNKTYATRENAIKAVEKIYGGMDNRYEKPFNFRYMIVKDEADRWFPICIGNDAVHAGTFNYFVTVG